MYTPRPSEKSGHSRALHQSRTGAPFFKRKKPQSGCEPRPRKKPVNSRELHHSRTGAPFWKRLREGLKPNVHHAQARRPDTPVHCSILARELRFGKGSGKAPTIMCTTPNRQARELPVNSTSFAQELRFGKGRSRASSRMCTTPRWEVWALPCTAPLSHGSSTFKGRNFKQDVRRAQERIPRTPVHCTILARELDFAYAKYIFRETLAQKNASRVSRTGAPFSRFKARRESAVRVRRTGVC